MIRAFWRDFRYWMRDNPRQADWLAFIAWILAMVLLFPPGIYYWFRYLSYWWR